ncbi:DUF4345 domain-containing protein [Saccharothrix australiensis]|uniref:Uncharacterized protein DUF4345 n=1 Tax=Saccharothrix australiensis TaxID=2072 RepID=A0A495W1Y3_9PSEU|nr:DUF4345 domain-containing protein [Saccharothrix australiensis]RKT54725.1 uncharacterized protein DUF4345 [Saccharothrix australiensis]
MAGVLRWLVAAMGVACVAIGLFHLGWGIDSVPGEGAAGATVDSRERFYNAVFLGYGLAWLWAARQRPVPATAVRWLAGILLLGGVGRVLSMAVHGQPHWFQVVLTATEFVLPVIYFLLANADERHPATTPRQ